MQPNNWHVITGGPSVGKSTLLAELERLGYKTIPEAARILIDQAVIQGMTAEELRKDERKFQFDVARLKDEIEQKADPDIATFFDRGMHDTAAYLDYYGFVQPPWITDLIDNARYLQVFLLEPLQKFSEDYARTEDQDFTHDLHRLLKETYSRYGMDPIIVPDIGLNNRVRFILEHVKQK